MSSPEEVQHPPQCIRCNTPIEPGTPLFQSHLCPCTYHSACFFERLKTYMSGHWFECPIRCFCGTVLYTCTHAPVLDDTQDLAAPDPSLPETQVAAAQAQPTFRADAKALRAKYLARARAKKQVITAIAESSTLFKAFAKPLMEQIKTARKESIKQLRQSQAQKEHTRAIRAAAAQETVFRTKYDLSRRAMRQLFPSYWASRRSTMIPYVLRRRFRLGWV
jgi:hypothetical protein